LFTAAAFCPHLRVKIQLSYYFAIIRDLLFAAMARAERRELINRAVDLCGPLLWFKVRYA
jgi:hypothetical protein